MSRTANPNTAARSEIEKARKIAKKGQQNLASDLGYSIRHKAPQAKIDAEAFALKAAIAEEADAKWLAHCLAEGLPVKDRGATFAGFVKRTMAGSKVTAEGTPETASEEAESDDEQTSIPSTVVGTLVTPPEPFKPTPKNAPGGLNSDRPAVHKAV